jgi:PAS domain S-box-containing protein
VESVARIGSYSLDISSGRWVSSKRLDAIYGIDAGFDRSVEGWTSLIHPADREAMVAYFADEVLGRAQPFDREYRIVRADTGEERWVYGRGALELDASGRPLRMLGTIADITEQVATERERARLVEGLRRSERNLAEAQRISHIGSWEWDLATETAQRSEELHRIYGVEPGTIPGTTEAFLAFVHPDDRARVQASERAAITGSGQYALDYRAVRPDGTVRIIHDEAELVHDEHGAPVRMVGTVQDITEQREAQDALIASELRYAAIFEGTAEAILIADLATGRYRWVNPAACAMLGYTRDELVGLTVHDIHPATDLPTVLDRFQAIADGRTTMARSVPCQRKDGTVRLADIRGSQAIVDGVACNIGFFTDVTDLRRLEVQDRKLAQAIDQTSEAILITGPTAEIDYVNPAFERLSGLGREDLVGGSLSLLGSPQSTATFDAMWRTLSGGESWVGDLVHHHRDGTERVAVASISPVHDTDGTVMGFVARARDVTEERALAVERERLATVVEQTSDSVIIADLTGTIEYVNPAFERASGYRRDEAVGQNPRILKSGRQSAAFYRALWRRLTRGQTWTGTLINRRKDGSLYQEDATISPIRGPGGEVTGYVAVQRDVTALRAAESGLAREFRERAEVAAALARLQPGPSAEATAALICGEVLGLPSIDLVAIFTFLDPEHAFVLASAGPANEPLVPGRPLPVARARYLYERAAQGPWAEAWRTRPEDGQYGRQIAELGLRASAFAPIRNADRLLGVVAVGTRDEAYVRHLIDHLPAVGEFAATARALLSGQLERGHRDELVRERVGRALAEGGLRPVFQPIVALASAEPVGYEALTRFADGTPPDRMITDAHSVGLGLELEVACLAAALDASESLAADCWLSLNASPDVILQSSELAGLLRDRSRRFVIEITEHVGIDDYAAVRRAVAGFGPTVRLAVDDAGAGFASLRHVVELRPQFLKLDVSLVRHVDRDLTRQAMIAGLRHFAGRIGCEVIAEGIEEPAELEMLRELGVSFGQGYLLGRPEPLPIASGNRATRAGNNRPPAGRRANGRSSPEVSPARGISGSSRPMSRMRGGSPRPSAPPG